MTSADRFEQLAARGRARAEAAGKLEDVVITGLDPLHAAVLGFFDQVLGLVDGDNMPPVARTMMTMIKTSRPMMIDALGKMPPERLEAVLNDVRDRIDNALYDAATDRIQREEGRVITYELPSGE